jgi:dihydrofolate synthase / folylpolyglutamate synthase
MSYVSAVDHLHALVHDAGPTAIKKKFDLGHMRTLAAALGDPQLSFASVLIAGTNGKGSTAATLASILGAAGYRVALYTSPHLCRVTERIRVNQRVGEVRGSEPAPSAALTEIAEDDFARLYFRVEEVARGLVSDGRLAQPPSFFEVLTSVGFLYFAERAVDIAVLEVGLGGRLDATNIADPLVSVITDVSLDHQEFLGDTIAEIAREKAGILRPGGVLVTLPQHPEANSAIGEIAMELGVRGVSATGYLPGRDTNPDRRSPEGSRPVRGSLLYANDYDLNIDGEPLKVRSPLAGQHQQRNIALAISVANELRENHRYSISNAAITEGIQKTAWPGRLEFIAPDVLVDVAHNPAGAWTLRAAIAGLPEELPRTLLFSCLREKNLSEIAQILFPLFDRTGGRPEDHIVFAPIDNPRAVRIEDLVSAALALDVPVETADDISEGLAIARAVTQPGGLIIATGSVYLVGALRELLLAK